MDQNQNTPPPNFDFILNQPEPQAKPPRKMNTKVIIIIVLVVVLGIILLIGVFLPGDDKTATQNGPVQNNAADLADQTDVSASSIELVKQYFNFIGNQNGDAAYDLLSPEQKATVPREAFEDMTIKTFSSTIDLYNCVVAEQVGVGDKEATVTYVCPVKSNNKSIVFTVKVISVDGAYKINGYAMKVDAR